MSDHSHVPQYTGFFLISGAAIGVVVGTLTGSLGVAIAIGAGLGLFIGGMIENRALKRSGKE